MNLLTSRSTVCCALCAGHDLHIVTILRALPGAASSLCSLWSSNSRKWSLHDFSLKPSKCACLDKTPQAAVPAISSFTCKISQIGALNYPWTSLAYLPNFCCLQKSKWLLSLGPAPWCCRPRPYLLRLMQMQPCLLLICWAGFNTSTQTMAR